VTFTTQQKEREDERTGQRLVLEVVWDVRDAVVSKDSDADERSERSESARAAVSECLFEAADHKRARSAVQLHSKGGDRKSDELTRNVLNASSPTKNDPLSRGPSKIIWSVSVN
jgi:hypothetical protein